MSKTADLEWLGLLVTVAICSILLFGFFRVMIMAQQTTFGSSGQIRAGAGLGIFDAGAGLSAGELKSIDWGLIEPAENKSHDIIVQNKGARTMTFSLATGNFLPVIAQSFISLDWNYTGTKVNTQNTIPIRLTIRVSPSIENVTDFSFDIIISSDAS